MAPTTAAMTPEEFAQWIEDHGYTRESLATALRQNRTSLYKWMNGRHPVTPIIKLALDFLASRKPLTDEPDRVFAGENLERWMEENAFDDELLAEAFGVHPLSVIRWRTNVHPISWPMRLALMRLASDRRALAARKRLRSLQDEMRTKADRKLEEAREKARQATLAR